MHMDRMNRPSRVFFTVILASICSHAAKLDVVLILQCLQKRFSIMVTYFYMTIKFPSCVGLSHACANERQEQASQ